MAATTNMDVETSPTVGVEVQTSPDLMLLTAYGPSDASFHVWWHETPQFSLAEYLPGSSLFRSGMELLRRKPGFDGAAVCQAIKAWFWEEFQQRPVSENNDDEMQDWILNFECDAELHNCHHAIRRWTMDAVIRGKLRITINIESSETEMDLTFVSNGLHQRFPWPQETETRYGAFPLVKSGTSDLSTPDVQGLILKVLSTERTERLCVVM